jgi:hypothetical protein
MNRHNLNGYWKTVVDSIQDGVMIVDPAGRLPQITLALILLLIAFNYDRGAWHYLPPFLSSQIPWGSGPD